MVITVPWSFFAGLSTFGIDGMRIPGVKTHIYILSFLCFFNFIYFAISPNKFKIHDQLKVADYKLRYKLIATLNIFSWFYMIPIMLRAYKIILNYGFLAIRDNTFSSSSESMLYVGLDKFISRIIIQSIFQATVILAMVNVSFKKKTQWLTGMAIINVIIMTFTFGGRFDVIQILIYYILSVLMTNNIIGNTEKKLKISYRYIILLIGGLALVTYLRGSNGFIKSIIAYYSGSFSFLDYILSNPDVFHLNHKLWGSATFGFVAEPIILILKIIFNLDIRIASYYINIVTQPFYQISPGRYFNALTTIIYPFIRDFGFSGLIIGSSFLVGVTTTLERKFMQTKSIVYYALYIHMNYIIFNSILNYSLLSYSSIVIIFFIILFTKE